MTRPRIGDHHDFILKKVPLKGASWVARQLNLERHCVWHYANRRGIRFGDIPGFVKVSEVATRAGVAPSFAHTAAHRDGAYRLIGDFSKHAAVRNRLGIVPEKWADAFVADQHARQTGDEARDAGYLTVKELMILWRVGRGTITRGVNGTGILAPMLKTARIVRGGGTTTGTIYVNPHDAERIRITLETNRVRAKRMVSTKSLSIELGIAQSTAADFGREAGGELLLIGGRVARFVTPETANEIRERIA